MAPIFTTSCLIGGIFINALRCYVLCRYRGDVHRYIAYRYNLLDFHVNLRFVAYPGVVCQEFAGAYKGTFVSFQ